MMTEIDIDNPAHQLYPRMYASVTVDLVRHPDAIRLPVSAVGALDQSPFVFIVSNGRLIRKPVSVGINDAHYVEITSGLSGNELVVAAIRPTLQNGELVGYSLLNNSAAANAASDS
jgi:multidrug efflux pump subunit AcrA (membrane-fusion protein)